MTQSTILHTGRASLCALGEYLRRRCCFAPLREQLPIAQTTVRYRPRDKVLEALVGLLCGAKTIAQSNVTIRTDPAVQRAFGRTACADQSTIARTLRACTGEHVAQLERVSWYDLKRYGATPPHRFAEQRWWVDIDLTPMPLGAKAEGSERPWMGRNRSLNEFWYYVTVFGRYPRAIYRGSLGSVLYFLLAYLLPILLVVSVPAEALANKELFQPHLALVAMGGAAGCLLVSRWIFQRALVSYRSASS